MNGRVLGWCAVLLAGLVIGVLVYRDWADTPVAPSAMAAPDPAVEQPFSAIRVIMEGCTRVGKRIEFRGYVENTGELALSTVTVQVIWKDEYKEIIDTSLVYAVGSDDPLSPGERRFFTETTSLRKVAACNVRPLDWWVSS